MFLNTFRQEHSNSSTFEQQVSNETAFDRSDTLTSIKKRDGLYSKMEELSKEDKCSFLANKFDSKNGIPIVPPSKECC